MKRRRTQAVSRCRRFARAAAMLATVAWGSAAPGAVPGPPPNDARPAGRALQTLSPKSCYAAADGEIARRLPDAWAAFAAATRVCPLRRSAHDTAHVFLVSVFAESYAAGRDAQAPWPDFPRPMLVSSDGRCLARLSELYPFDEPRTLVVRFGRWESGIPTEVRTTVLNPAVGGDYELPPLRWDAERRRYDADPTSADGRHPRGPECPT